MHKLSRSPLATLVCPWAPFLVPRLLRVTALGQPRLHSHPQPCSYSVSRSPKATPKLGLKTAEAYKRRSTIHSYFKILKQLREACETRNIHRVMDLYPTLREAGVLNVYDTRRITQTLHVRIRMANDYKKRAELLAFVQQIADDVRGGVLEPQHYAYVHLLGIYKDCKYFQEGRALWDWLVQQDDRHVSPAAYGAAIELMAYGNLMTLPDLESLYSAALQRFPATFAEYHLSPDAIVPDRTQPTLIPGIPIILLQGILTARILARDWKNAYLALDVALRLYPSAVPPRYFELFMGERSLSEAYTAYMLACRAGVVIRPVHVTTLLTKMRAAVGSSRSMADRMMLIRAMANALYASVQAGGELQSIYVGIFIHSMTQLLPENISEQNLESVGTSSRRLIASTVQEIISGLLRAGMTPQIHPFDALITLSGKFQIPDLLITTLQDVKAAGIELGPIATRDAISAAGLLRNTAVIEHLWDRIVTEAETEGSAIGFENWITLTKACRRADHKDYFEQQLLRLPHAIEQGTANHIRKQINQPDAIPDPASLEYLPIEQLSSELTDLKSQMENVEAVLMSGQPLNIIQTPFHMHLNPEHASLGSVADLRIIYNQMSTDPYQPSLPPPSPEQGVQVPIPKSPTGIPFDELRFQNWVTVLEMMSDAEAYEHDLQFYTNVASKSGNPIQGSPELLLLHQDTSVTFRTLVGLRNRIKTLRSIAPTDVPAIRYTPAPKTTSKPKVGDDSRHKVNVNARRLGGHTGSQQTPNLTYYLGLKSDHTAPLPKKAKSVLGIQRLNHKKGNSGASRPDGADTKDGVTAPTDV